MTREVKERTILDTFAEDFAGVIEKHAKYVIVSGFVAIAFKEELLRSEKDIDDAEHLRIIYSDVLDETEIIRIKAEIRRLRLS